jgi:hypothetical protein
LRNTIQYQSFIKSRKILFVLATVLTFFTVTTVRAQVELGSTIDYTEPRKMKLAGITVMGAEYTDAQAILLFCGLKVGQEIMIPGDDIADALRKLWKNQLFSSIDIRLAEARGDDAFLVIIVKELPKLGVFKFDGIKKGDADNLREKMKIRSGNIVNENLKATAINIIKDFYIEKVNEDTEHVYIKAMAGEAWHQFVLYCVNNNYAGIENLSLIPGCVGAAPMQNIGAYGVEIKDTCYEVEAYNIETNEQKIFSNDENNF